MLRPNLPKAVSLMSNGASRELFLPHYPETHVDGGIVVTPCSPHSLWPLQALLILYLIVLDATQLKRSVREVS